MDFNVIPGVLIWFWSFYCISKGDKHVLLPLLVTFAAALFNLIKDMCVATVTQGCNCYALLLGVPGTVLALVSEVET